MCNIFMDFWPSNYVVPFKLNLCAMLFLACLPSSGHSTKNLCAIFFWPSKYVVPFQLNVQCLYSAACLPSSGHSTNCQWHHWVVVYPGPALHGDFFPRCHVNTCTSTGHVCSASLPQAITPSTILLLCSAPEYCYGMVDPVPTISELAVQQGLPLHVDACFGGFMLPW